MEMFKVRSPVIDIVVETEEWPVATDVLKRNLVTLQCRSALPHADCAETRRHAVGGPSQVCSAVLVWGHRFFLK